MTTKSKETTAVPASHIAPTATPTTTAKFTCYQIRQNLQLVSGKNTPVETVWFHVVATGSKENEKFFTATPSGAIEIGTVKAGVFVIGKSYYVNFTICD